MTVFVVSLSIALVLTMIFGFRFGTWRSPKTMVGYFTLFFALEWAAEAWLLPPGALGLEVAYVCFGISGLFAAAIYVTQRLERASEESD